MEAFPLSRRPRHGRPCVDSRENDNMSNQGRNASGRSDSAKIRARPGVRSPGPWPGARSPGPGPGARGLGPGAWGPETGARTRCLRPRPGAPGRAWAAAIEALEAGGERLADALLNVEASGGFAETEIDHAGAGVGRSGSSIGPRKHVGKYLHFRWCFWEGSTYIRRRSFYIGPPRGAIKGARGRTGMRSFSGEAWGMDLLTRADSYSI